MEKHCSFLLFLIFVFSGCSNSQKTTTIKGEVIDFATESIILIRPHEDLRFDNVIEIPVVDGRFEHQLEIEEPEGYYLMLGEARENASGALMPLFLEEGNLNLTIYAEQDFRKNVVEGGKLNKEFLEFKQKVQEHEFQNWEEQQEWTKNYIQENESLVSYFLLLQDLTSGWEIEDLEPYRQSHKKLAAAFPDHSYSDLVEKIVEGHTSKIGKSYIDFSAPDIEGNMISLSEHIEGKVSLLNLWATWCAPCIRKSREIIPLVEKYREKGFTVIGVAGEFKSTENLENFLKRKEFPWLNLVELDRQNDLWARYGVPRSGGGMFLVDRDGKIIMKDPSAEELEAKLAILLP